MLIHVQFKPLNNPRKLGLKEDWAVVPFLIVTMLGFIITFYDFIMIQGISFKLNLIRLLGVFMFIFGGYLRFMSRRQLMKAGLTMLGSSRLVISRGQRLVTDGLYSRIRHPLYLGEIFRNLGFTLILTSGIGFFLVLVGCIFLFFRILWEEKMMLDAFGEDYKDYMKHTWRLILHLY